MQKPLAGNTHSTFFNLGEKREATWPVMQVAFSLSPSSSSLPQSGNLPVSGTSRVILDDITHALSRDDTSTYFICQEIVKH